MLSQVLSLPGRPCSLPLISVLSSASHFCHQFSNNCLHPLLNHSDILSACRNLLFLTIVGRFGGGGGFTLEL